jgi:hypothetical protein
MQNYNNALILMHKKDEKGTLTEPEATELAVNSRRMNDAAKAVERFFFNVERSAKGLLGDKQKKSPELRQAMDIFRAEMENRQLYLKMLSYVARLYATPYLPQVPEAQKEDFFEHTDVDETDLESVAPGDDDFDEGMGDRLEFEESAPAWDDAAGVIFSGMNKDPAVREDQGEPDEAVTPAQENMPEQESESGKKEAAVEPEDDRRLTPADEASGAEVPSSGQDMESKEIDVLSTAVEKKLSLDERRKNVGQALQEGKKYFREATAAFSFYKNSTFEYLEDPSTFLDAEQDVDTAIRQARSAEQAFIRARQNFGREGQLTRVPMEDKFVLITKDDVDAYCTASHWKLSLYEKYKLSPKSRPLCNATLARLLKMKELIVFFPGNNPTAFATDIGGSHERDSVEILVRYRPITAGDDENGPSLKFKKIIVIHLKLRRLKAGSQEIDLTKLRKKQVAYAHIKLKDRFYKTEAENYIGMRTGLGAALVREGVRQLAEK